METNFFRSLCLIRSTFPHQRLVFFLESEIEGISAISLLRKCHRNAIRSVSGVLHLENDENRYDESEEDEDDEHEEAEFQDFVIDVKDLLNE